MRHCAIVLVFLSLLTTACQKKVEIVQVPEADRLKAHRLLVDGDRLLREGKDHLALSRYVEASILNPGDPIVFDRLAIAYARIHMFPQGRNAARYALKLDKKYANAYNTLGIIELGEDNPEGATKSFRRAIQLSPNRAAFYANLGTAHLGSRKPEAAREAFAKAVAIDPEVFRSTGVIEISGQHFERDGEGFLEMARLFAEFGNRDATFHYLSRALTEGLPNPASLLNDKAFVRYRNEPEFLRILAAHGVHAMASTS